MLPRYPYPLDKAFIGSRCKKFLNQKTLSGSKPEVCDIEYRAWRACYPSPPTQPAQHATMGPRRSVSEPEQVCFIAGVSMMITGSWE